MAANFEVEFNPFRVGGFLVVLGSGFHPKLLMLNSFGVGCNLCCPMFWVSPEVADVELLRGWWCFPGYFAPVSHGLLMLNPFGVGWIKLFRSARFEHTFVVLNFCGILVFEEVGFLRMHIRNRNPEGIEHQ